MAYASPPSIVDRTGDRADVGVTCTEGMHDQHIAQVLMAYAEGGNYEALGVPHHTDLTLPNPIAGHVYLQTTTQWDDKAFRCEQKRPRIPDGMRCVSTTAIAYQNPLPRS